jgi:two-component system, OmpR family, sensor kinase
VKALRTLRGRLLIGILVLVTLGLGGTDLSIYYTISATVTLRVDRGLTNTADAIVHAQSKPDVLLRNIDTVVKRTEISVLMLGPDGQIVAAMPEAATPQQPYPLQRLDPPTLTYLRGHPGRPQEFKPAGTPYRIIYQPATDGMSLGDRAGVRRPVAAIVVATGFRGEQKALSRLAAQEALVSAAVLAVLAVLAVGVLRVGLRPLAGMAAAATTIANGESDRRLPVDRPHDEVGQLAAALNQAFDERHRAEDRLRHFIADASHELRTPLASIRGWADLYFQDALGEKDGVDTAMTRIMTDADRLIRVVEELLLLARLDEYRGLDADEVDLVELISEVVDGARMADATRQITVSVPDTATVTGDRDRLCQVIRNLVGNALQHTPPGTRVHITLDHSLDKPAAMHLTVADNGPGIATSDLERIFERFYRPSSARGIAGTGLGLAITRAIIRAHHGRITVESEPGIGTRFDVVLPA